MLCVSSTKRMAGYFIYKEDSFPVVQAFKYAYRKANKMKSIRECTLSKMQPFFFQAAQLFVI